MILVVDLTDPGIPLLSDEFVLPVLKILQITGNPIGMVHLNNLSVIPDEMKMIIICGTALADLWYNTILYPPILTNCKKPILGICAGMQVLLKTDGGEVVHSIEIGMTDVRVTHDGMTDPLTSGNEVLSVYSLHQNACTIPESWVILGVSEKGPQIVRSLLYPRYGLLFHPEVRNEWLVERFVKIFYE